MHYNGLAMFSVCLAEIVKPTEKFTGKLKYSTCYGQYLFNNQNLKTVEIEINGVKYQQKKQSKRKPMSKTLMAMMVMAEIVGSFGVGGVSRQKETPKVDIVKEYELIQQKKSNLSKNQRDLVVCQFEKNFERVSS